MKKFRKKVEFQGYLDIYLSKEHKALVKKNPLSGTQVVDFIVEVAEQGYKLSVSYDSHNETYICTLYGNHDTEGNAGYVLSQRHADVIVALSALCFMHTEVFDGNWPTATNTDW